MNDDDWHEVRAILRTFRTTEEIRARIEQMTRDRDEEVANAPSFAHASEILDSANRLLGYMDMALSYLETLKR